MAILPSSLTMIVLASYFPGMGVGAAISWVVHRIPPPFVGLENGSSFDAWVSFPAAPGLLPSDLPSSVNFVPIPLKEG